MKAELRQDLEAALQADESLDYIVALLRRHKAAGATQAETYALLESMREQARDETTEDRIVEIADFVAGFCSPHMKVWEG